MLIVLIPSATDESVDSLLNPFIAKMEKKYPDILIQVGIGTLWNGLDEFQKSYQESLQALLYLHSSEKVVDRICVYDTLNIEKLFFELQNKNVLKEICSKQLGPLIEYDTDNQADLINTLKMYIQKDGNLTNTAAALYIHVNTLRYRIKKIEQLLSIKLKNISQLFNMNLALEAQTFLNHFSEES